MHSLVNHGLAFILALVVSRNVAAQQRIDLPSSRNTPTPAAIVNLGTHYDQIRKANVSHFLDKSRIVTEGNVRRVWRLIDFDRPQEERIGYRYLSILFFDEIQCVNPGWRNLEIRMFSGNMGSGEMLKRDITAQSATSQSITAFGATRTPNGIVGQSLTKNFGTEASYEPITANSLAERVFQHVCR